jgi:hypothetical protein
MQQPEVHLRSFPFVYSSYIAGRRAATTVKYSHHGSSFASAFDPLFRRLYFPVYVCARHANCHCTPARLCRCSESVLITIGTGIGFGACITLKPGHVSIGLCNGILTSYQKKHKDAFVRRSIRTVCTSPSGSESLNIDHRVTIKHIGKDCSSKRPHQTYFRDPTSFRHSCIMF